MNQRDTIHQEGPGLHEINPGERWYGLHGCCSVCGDEATDKPTCAVVARAVRYWDVDDGWRVGILCLYCAEAIRKHGGPKAGDYAYDLAHDSRTIANTEDDARFIDSLAADVLAGDMDALASMFGYGRPRFDVR